jgi:hypothetical protein
LLLGDPLNSEVLKRWHDGPSECGRLLEENATQAVNDSTKSTESTDLSTLLLLMPPELIQSGSVCLTVVVICVHFFNWLAA